ncbi:MAG: septal ring lytic transglycosylase RlpA family protein [Solirubrobacterales bacterium]
MRRFRERRKRLAARTLLPFAALTTTTMLTAIAGTPASSANARIDASARSVTYGERVALRGSFAGAADAPIELHHRAKGSQAWRLVRHARTGAEGRYSVRVKPRASGYWRATLGEQPVTQAAGDGEAAPSPTADRSSGDTRIVVRSRTRASIAGKHATVGDTVKVRGRVAPTGAERRVVVRVGGSKESTTARADGRFAVSWRAGSTGTRKVKVVAGANRVAAGSRTKAGRVTVYRRAAASWYGPGLYGNRTACGGTLTPSTLGVAHKSMPCGTKLRLRYGGRSTAVRVIDRGPYSGNREFDLTAATKQKLGFPDTGTVLTSK